MKFIIGMLVGLLVAVAVVWGMGGQVSGLGLGSTTVTEQPQLLDVFRFTLEDEARKQASVPAAGYTPELLLQTFPGLAESDFATVDASGGTYRIENGSLSFVRDESGLVPETVGGLNRDGYQRLLQNVTARLDINLADTGTITDVVTAIARPR